MTIVNDAGPEARGPAVPGEPDPAASDPAASGPGQSRRHRWRVYLTLTVVLVATVTGILLFGIDTASASGGCGGG